MHQTNQMKQHFMRGVYCGSQPGDVSGKKKEKQYYVVTSFYLLERQYVCIGVTLPSSGRVVYFISALRRLSFSGLLEAIWEKSLKIS